MVRGNGNRFLAVLFLCDWELRRSHIYRLKVTFLQFFYTHVASGLAL